ncbi:hypothetical protein [Kitasatospora sp. GP82]|uniref:hypothetical protein n=1 Tax=Kitasatospora sp. GP82 TaxID=3035089 RepID=UPI0024770C81|nr:hypothetical protein [Kitasatospora sp. GP82]MDH6128323.1 hypothetical protein [Kitasatospora sp. GP82]
MTLPVEQLKEMLASAPDGFELSAEKLAVAEAEPLFTDFLGGDLVLDTAQGDPDRLTVRGELSADAAELTGLPAVVRFATDDDDTVVTGLEIAVAWPTWDIKTPFLDRGLGLLGSLGFASAYVVLEAAPDGFGRLVPMAVPGAGLAVDGAYVKFLDQGEPDRATVVGEFGDGLSFDSLSALAELPFIGSGVMDRFVLPDPVRSALSRVLVKDMSAMFDWSAPAFSQVSVDLALDTRGGWTLLDGLLSLDEFSAWLQLAPGPDGAPTVSGGLGARLSVGTSVSMTAGVTLPDLGVSATADRPEGGADLVSGHLPDDLARAVTELDYLYVRCDVPTLTYLLAIGLDLHQSAAAADGHW